MVDESMAQLEADVGGVVHQNRIGGLVLQQPLIHRVGRAEVARPSRVNGQPARGEPVALGGRVEPRQLHR